MVFTVVCVCAVGGGWCVVGAEEGRGEKREREGGRGESKRVIEVVIAIRLDLTIKNG